MLYFTLLFLSQDACWVCSFIPYVSCKNDNKESLNCCKHTWKEQLSLNRHTCKLQLDWFAGTYSHVAVIVLSREVGPTVWNAFTPGGYLITMYKPDYPQNVVWQSTRWEQCNANALNLAWMCIYLLERQIVINVTCDEHSVFLQMNGWWSYEINVTIAQ